MKDLFKKLPVALLAGLMALTICPPAIANDEEAGPDMRPMVAVDKQDIRNKTDNRRANFSALIDRITMELLNSGVYRVLEMDMLGRALETQDKFSAVGDDGGIKSNVKSPGYILRLTVTTYGAMDSHTREHSGARRVNEATVEFILNITNAASGELVKAVNISASMQAGMVAARGNVKVSNLKERALQAACQKAAKQVVTELLKFTPFYVIDVNGNTIMVDIPGRFTRVGEQFNIMKVGRRIRNRRTGKIIQRKELVAVAQVTKLDEDSCDAQIISLVPGAKIKVDYIVERIIKENMPATAPAAAPGVVPSGAAPF